MTFSRTAAILALLLPVALAAQGAAPQPTAAQLKARAELARQRALQQQAQTTKAPATTTAAPTTKTAAPQTNTAATQAKSPAGAQTKTVTAPTTQTKTASVPPAPVPVPQTKTATPQTKTAAAPPPAPQTKTATGAPAGSALAAGQQQQATAGPKLQVKPPAEVTFNREVFAYVKGTRRDPFTTMITSSDLRPQITDLKLVTVIRAANAASSVAIMRDLTTNEQYRVRVGQTLGRMRVAQIQQRAVVFSIEEFGYNRQEVVSMDDSTRARTP
jgi:outer membrane biosynthesis protein TonB